MSLDPIRPCPYCGTDCRADWTDVGVGDVGVQTGPYYCEACEASQIGPYDVPRGLTPEEKKIGWYRPGSPVGSSVNAVNGVPISATEALLLYRLENRFGIQILDPKEMNDRKEEEHDQGQDPVQ